MDGSFDTLRHANRLSLWYLKMMNSNSYMAMYNGNNIWASNGPQISPPRVPKADESSSKTPSDAIVAGDVRARDRYEAQDSKSQATPREKAPNAAIASTAPKQSKSGARRAFSKLFGR